MYKEWLESFDWEEYYMKRTRIFVAHAVPEDKVLEYGVSVAACNFCRHLIQDGLFDKVYTLLPTNVCCEVEPFEGLVYSTLRRRGGLWCMVALLVENVRLFRALPRQCSVWLYNCTVLNALLVILLRLFRPSVKLYLILLDYTPNHSLLQRFLLWLSNRMDGTIRLADSPLFTCRNSVCLPGVVPSGAAEYPRVEAIPHEFLVSGVLAEQISMLPMLLETFAEMPELKLHISGKAPDESLVRAYALRCPNIVYHGMLQYGEYLDLLHHVPFLLSTRDPQAPENLCNFPSKIIEGLLHNRIIISSMHYHQLEGIKYIETSVNQPDFRATLQRVTQMSSEELLSFANQSDMVKRLFCSEVWMKWMETIENK